MLLTTTDTLPVAYTPLGLVRVPFVAAPPARTFIKGVSALDDTLRRPEDALRDRAGKMGADAVIGVRVASLFGNNCAIMGTAVKLG